MNNFQALLFDCDGVLVDSELITQEVLRSMLAELGWQMTLAQCMQLFVGKLFQDHQGLIEEKTGAKLSADWFEEFRWRRNKALETSLQPIPHIHASLEHLRHHYGNHMACASGADRGKVELQLRKTQLSHFFEGRIFSGVEMARSKPAPDVYLAAAKALGVDPQRCAVIEDSPTGVTAGVAAGCTVFAFCPEETSFANSAALRNAGAIQVFASMRQLPQLLKDYGSSRAIKL